MVINSIYIYINFLLIQIVLYVVSLLLTINYSTIKINEETNSSYFINYCMGCYTGILNIILIIIEGK